MKMDIEAQSHAPAWRRGLQLANDAPRCGARCRSGLCCRVPAMKNGRCRMHGGASPGAPRGIRNGRHGRYTIAKKTMMAETRQLGRVLRALLEAQPMLEQGNATTGRMRLSLNSTVIPFV